MEHLHPKIHLTTADNVRDAKAIGCLGAMLVFELLFETVLEKSISAPDNLRGHPEDALKGVKRWAKNTLRASKPLVQYNHSSYCISLWQ